MIRTALSKHEPFEQRNDDFFEGEARVSRSDLSSEGGVSTVVSTERSVVVFDAEEEEEETDDDDSVEDIFEI